MVEPVRVLHVFGIMDRGGAETMVMNHYRKIDRLQIQFDFLVLHEKEGAYDAEIKSLGGQVHRVPSLFEYTAHKKEVALFFAVHREYRIVHVHIGELGYVIYKEATRQRVPVIIGHAHNAACDRNWKWPLRTILKHLIRPYITIPMTCGADAATWLFGRKMADKAIMLNNAIDARQYTYDEEVRQQVRNEMGWNNHFVIGDVARFSPPKNHFGLLSIFKTLLAKEPTALLVLIGDKIELYQEVCRKAEDLGISHAVQFLGTRSDISRLLQGMDVYCSPSLYEGLSVSMVEAQAAGLRVVTSDKVPQQVAIIPELLSFIPLAAKDEMWGDFLLKPYNRINTFGLIATAGFDIHANAAWLQNFYLSQHHSK